MAALLWSAAARADDFDAYRVACDDTQSSAAQAAVAEARDKLTSAIDSLPPVNSAIGAKFQRWFGGPEGDDDPVIKKVYTEVRGFLTFKSFWCPNKSMPQDEPGTLAFVPDGSFSEVFLESGFFDLPVAGANSRGGAILHEVSHQATTASIVDNAYGTPECEDMARASPKLARRNADSLEYFAEDVADGIP
ncbi:M35 family metallo-endopeptidase [Mesorhizobium sp. CA5]|uniref:M35 family metallo-endopeptidase n=1 Tax=Mesorhizobium sp. CA5 TaxID=2876638 RepID=UPI001CD0CD7D|nr:M35 family metallo-endopeptidase [Mesorhizobium sp. CA5]MBZ9843355.1 M35 family metallopeptidase [Mesorhizobium sp. CA5]